MGKIFKDMAKRNMAKAAAMMMLMFGTMQQSSAGITDWFSPSNVIGAISQGASMVKDAVSDVNFYLGGEEGLVNKTMDVVKSAGGSALNHTISLGNTVLGSQEDTLTGLLETASQKTVNWYVNSMKSTINKVSDAIVKNQGYLSTLCKNNFNKMNVSEIGEMLTNTTNQVQEYGRDIYSQNATVALKQLAKDGFASGVEIGKNILKKGVGLVKDMGSMVYDNPAMAMTAVAALGATYVTYRVMSNWFGNSNSATNNPLVLMDSNSDQKSLRSKKLEHHKKYHGSKNRYDGCKKIAKNKFLVPVSQQQVNKQVNKQVNQRKSNSKSHNRHR